MSRSRRLDLICLAWALTVNLVGGTDLVHSEFGKATGVVPTTTDLSDARPPGHSSGFDPKLLCQIRCVGILLHAP